MRSSAAAAAADVANSNLPGKSRRQRNCGRQAGRRTDGRAGGGETGSGRRAEAASEYRARLISSPIGRNNALLSPPLPSAPLLSVALPGRHGRHHVEREFAVARPPTATVICGASFGCGTGPRARGVVPQLRWVRASVCDHRGSFSFWHRLSPGLPNYSMRELSASPPVAASPGIARVGRLRYFARRIRGRDKCSLILPFLFV